MNVTVFLITNVWKFNKIGEFDYMAPRFETSRFHVNFGPSSLFERVHFKMRNSRTLKLHSKHFIDRQTKRNIPEEVMFQIKHFTPSQWSLKTVEVRNDTGKFINMTWEMNYNDARFWITIGFGDVIQTIIMKDSNGQGYPYIKSGKLYDYVQIVNEQLMISDNQLSIKKET